MAADTDFLDRVVSTYLYGEDTLPENKLNPALVRDSGNSTIPVDLNAYMNSAGRFAYPANFELVRRFFAQSDIIANGAYSKAEMEALLGIDSFTERTFSFQQYEYADEVDDWAIRTLIWNSVIFKINDDVEFWILPDGTPEIRNLYIEPLQQQSGQPVENYDLESSDIATQILNDLVLAARQDPSGIGRRVNFQFVETTGPIAPIDTYVRGDFESQLDADATFRTLGIPYLIANSQQILSLLETQFNKGVTKFLDGSSRPIIYGTNSDDSIRVDSDGVRRKSDDNLLFEQVLGDYHRPFLGNGVAIVGGAGSDELFGGLYDDLFIADADDVEFDGGSGFDTLDFSESDTPINWTNLKSNVEISGIDKVVGSSGDDTFVLEEGAFIFSGEQLEVDGADGDDTILGNGEDNKFSGGSGDDTIEGKEGEDLINGDSGDDLLGGGADNDTIFGGSGDDSIGGGAGNDEIHGGADDDLINGEEGADKIWGDDGNDHIVGKEGADQLRGGDGNDILVGGEGSDLLIGGRGNDILDGKQEDSSSNLLNGGAANDDVPLVQSLAA